MRTRYRHPISRLPLLDGAPAATVDRLGSLMTSVQAAAGTVLVRQGAANRQFLLVEEGTLRVDRDGERVALLGPGEFAGEISLLGDGIATATVTAETDVVFFVSSTAEFHALLDTVLGKTITGTAAARTAV
jgi:CRP/FNR family cyclic AMP-dependent transcriptional regulator